jgi:CRISPR-associated protein Csd1
VVRNNRLAAGKSHPPAFALPLLLEAIAEPKERRKEGIPAPIATQLYASAVLGRPYPINVFQRALMRYRVEILEEEDEQGGWNARTWNDARSALIKAYLCRNQRKELTHDMNPNCTEQGYVLGQLLAVLGKLQQVALGDVNSGVVERYFSGASTVPRSVFPSLLRNARHHVAKAMDDRQSSWLVGRYERLIDHLCDQFTPQDSNQMDVQTRITKMGFPALLDMEQQGLFVLGFHQMRKWLWLNREERSTWEKENDGAPRAYLWTTATKQENNQ